MLKDMVLQYRGLPKQVYIMLIARIVAATGAFVYPFITMLLSSRLDFSDQEISIYLLVLATSYVPASLLGGKLADRFNRKHVFITVMFVADVAFFIGGFYCNSVHIIYLILIGYFFMNMGSPVIAAMMMDITNPSNRQESLSLCYLGMNLGIAVGPLIAGFLFYNYTRWIFWGEAVINLFSILIVAIGISDTRPSQEDMDAIAADESRKSEKAGEGGLFYQLMKNPIVIIFSVIGISYTFSYAQMSYVMPLHLEEIFGIEMGSKYIGIMWSVNGLAVFFITPVVVYFFKKFSPVFNVSLSGIWYALGFGLYAFTENIVIILLLVVVWSTGEVISAANTGVFIANHAPVTHRARFQSIYEIIQGTGRAVGPLLMSYFLLGHTFSQGWLLVGVISLSAGIGYYILYRCSEQNSGRTM